MSAERELDERVHVEIMKAMVAVGSTVARVPSYSTDIAAAWRVADHLRAQGLWIQVQDMRRFGVDEWEVEFASSGRDGYAKAATLPLAITMAALAAQDAADVPLVAPESAVGGRKGDE